MEGQTDIQYILSVTEICIVSFCFQGSWRVYSLYSFSIHCKMVSLTIFVCVKCSQIVPSMTLDAVSNLNHFTQESIRTNATFFCKCFNLSSLISLPILRNPNWWLVCVIMKQGNQSDTWSVLMAALSQEGFLNHQSQHCGHWGRQFYIRCLRSNKSLSNNYTICPDRCKCTGNNIMSYRDMTLNRGWKRKVWKIKSPKGVKKNTKNI